MAAKNASWALVIILSICSFAGSGFGQADEMCRELGETPSREVGRDNRLVPFIYGKIILKGLPSGSTAPRVTVTYSDSLQPARRQPIGRSGNYCFPKRGTGAVLIIDIDGMEVARKSVSDMSTMRLREDFEVYPPSRQTLPPGVISTKFTRPPNEKTLELYKKTTEAEQNRRPDAAIEFVKEIVAIDPEDFIAWAKLGSLYADRNKPVDAEAAFTRSLMQRPDYTPAMLNFGMMKAFQNQFPEAIEIFKQAVAAEPNLARGHRLLGEAYLQNRQGTMGLASLDEALRLDPVGMAECHLLKARLYDLVGAKNLAVVEYKAFLEKVREHPERKKFEKYVKDNIAN